MDEDRGAGRSTRFKPGRSGNPKGRPRRNKVPETGSAFDVLINRRVTVRMDGVDRELSVDEALLHRTYQDALAGGSMAIRTILKAITELDATRTPARRRFPTVTTEYPNPADIDQALLILDIASQAPDAVREDGRPYLKLEPWAASSALARHKRSFWSESSVEELKENTLNPEAVDWPRGDGR